MRRIASGAALVLAGLILAAGASLLGWRVAGPSESDTELGRVSFEVAPEASFGNIDAYVPIADWGIRADAFDAPFDLRAEVRSLDRRGALEAAGGDREALTETRTDLEAAAKGAAVRGFAFGLGASFIVATLLWLLRSRWRRAGALGVLVALTGVAGAAASLALASTTFDTRAFSTPSYYGRGPELAQLLAFFERQQENDRYTETFDSALTNFSAYLTDAPRTGVDEGRTLYLGSDLHSNVPILSELAEFVGGEPLLLAGDFGTAGTQAEADTVAPRVASLSGQVVGVSGNHDSELFMEALADEDIEVVGTDGILTSSGEFEPGLLDVQGLELAGFSDPLEWTGPDPGSAERIFSFPELDDGDERLAAAKVEVERWFDAMLEKPDIVLVHQSSLALHLASVLADNGYAEPLTIVTGHSHFQQIDRYAGGQINVVNAGTLGAGGPLRVGQEAAGLGRLDFAAAEPTLRSVDLIQIEPLSGQARAERVILDVVCPPEEAVDEPCRYEPF